MWLQCTWSFVCQQQDTVSSMTGQKHVTMWKTTFEITFGGGLGRTWTQWVLSQVKDFLLDRGAPAPAVFSLLHSEKKPTRLKLYVQMLSGLICIKNMKLRPDLNTSTWSWSLESGWTRSDLEARSEQDHSLPTCLLNPRLSAGIDDMTGPMKWRQNVLVGPSGWLHCRLRSRLFNC